MADNSTSRDLYLDLMERVLTNTIYEDAPQDGWSGGVYERERREKGGDWPSVAHTMIGVKRLRNIRFAVEQVIKLRVPGDLLEAGVWRGGASIYMRAILKAYGETARNVWCADSFEGLPKPDEERYPKDKGDRHHTHKALAISFEEVKTNFRKYELLDDQVKFLKGWFKDTLHCAPIEKLAVLRLDGDMYQSTMETLQALYPRVSPGGFVIVDDYGGIANCREAIKDFRAQNGIDEPLNEVDWTAVYWQRKTSPLKRFFSWY